ncbi:hypothetical protein AFB00_21990 [Pseudonocardia sp. HH130630-07]|nr:hypothetical protein AFB00_21990 [Pseudonocardia sp. HH130630-07]
MRPESPVVTRGTPATPTIRTPGTSIPRASPPVSRHTRCPAATAARASGSSGPTWPTSGAATNAIDGCRLDVMGRVRTTVVRARTPAGVVTVAPVTVYLYT